MTPLWDSLGHFHPLSVVSLSCDLKFPCWPSHLLPPQTHSGSKSSVRVSLSPSASNRQPGRPWASPCNGSEGMGRGTPYCPPGKPVQPCWGGAGAGRGMELSGDLFLQGLSPLEERWLNGRGVAIQLRVRPLWLNSRLLCGAGLLQSDVPHVCPFLLVA